MTTYDLTHGTTGNDPAWRLPLGVGVALAFGALAVAVVSRGGPTAGRPPTVVAETRDLTTTLAADGALRHEGESVVAYASAVATTSRPPGVPIGTGTATGTGSGAGTGTSSASSSGSGTGFPGDTGAGGDSGVEAATGADSGAGAPAIEPISAVTPLSGPAVASATAADLAGTTSAAGTSSNHSVDLSTAAEPAAAGGPAAAAQDPPQTTSDPCPPPEPGATPTTTDCPTTSTTVPPTTEPPTTPPTTSTPPTTPPTTEPPTTPPADPGTTSPGSGAPDTGSTTTSGGSGPTSTTPDAEVTVLPPARLTGMLAVGARADRGSVIYMAEAEPVVALIGDLPAWRSLRADVADGPDVRQLEDNLAVLGYDVGGPADTRYTDATTAAVAAWETDLGRPSPDGVVTMGEVVFLPTAGDVTGHQAAVGDVLGTGAPVLKVGASRRTVVAEVDQVEAGGWARGTAVTLTWSDGTTSSGVVVGAAGTGTGTGDTVEVGVALAAADANGHGAGATARLESDARREQAVAVPVEAVLVHEGRSALRLAQRGGDRVVPVETGVVADGWVEITAGLAAGQEVRLPPDTSDT